jgi:hypothetical protein
MFLIKSLQRQENKPEELCIIIWSVEMLTEECHENLLASGIKLKVNWRQTIFFFQSHYMIISAEFIITDNLSSWLFILVRQISKYIESLINKLHAV